MSVYGPLVTPDEIIDLLINVARNDTVRAEHLAELERSKGLRAQSIGVEKDFKTIGRIGDEGDRKPQDWSPSLMFFLAGTTDRPTLDEDRHLQFVWTIAAEVTWLGTNRTDAERGSQWLAMAAAQMLLQRTPRDGVLQKLQLTDFEPQPLAAGQRLGAVRLMFEATVPQSLALNGALPLGMGDLPNDPYGPPPEWPEVTSASSSIDKEPLQP